MSPNAPSPHDQRGFALVESIATLTFCSAALLVMLSTTYAAFAKMWLDRAAYETSICLSTPATTLICERTLRETTAQALPIGHVENVILSRGRHEVQTHFRWRFTPALALRVEDIRAVPLLGPPPKVAAR